ncbi:hypothetical protein J6590_086127 [Homalodisca vitripennis]|nr:hypothetical protein J6590_086127 [Homalodisca vitripennis]
MLPVRNKPSHLRVKSLWCNLCGYTSHKLRTTELGSNYAFTPKYEITITKVTSIWQSMSKWSFTTARFYSECCTPSGDPTSGNCSPLAETVCRPTLWQSFIRMRHLSRAVLRV